MPSPTTPQDWDAVRTAFASSILVDTALSSLAENLDGPLWPNPDKSETPANYIDFDYDEAVAALLLLLLLTQKTGLLAGGFALLVLREPAVAGGAVAQSVLIRCAVSAPIPS